MTAALIQWRCDRCAATGEIPDEADLTANRIVSRLLDAHEAIAPDCAHASGVAFVRIVEWYPAAAEGRTP